MKGVKKGMYILTPCDMLSSPIYHNMCVVYRKMGLSEKEIAERVLCKTAAVISRHSNALELDVCDINLNNIPKTKRK